MQRAANFPQNVPFGTTHFEHGRTFEFVEPGMWKSIGGSGGDGEGGGGEGGFLTWQKVVVSGFQCEANNQYLDAIGTANPTVSLPQLTNSDEGAFVEIADGRSGWADKPLTVALNGPLQGSGATEVVLDFDRVIVTFVWLGSEWTVYTTMATQGLGDAPEDGVLYGRRDGQWVAISGSGTREITTADIALTNPVRFNFETQEDANQWFYAEIEAIKVGGGGTGGGGSTDWSAITNKPAPIVNLAGETKASFVQGGNY
jgi:hypothetical protein